MSYQQKYVRAMNQPIIKEPTATLSRDCAPIVNSTPPNSPNSSNPSDDNALLQHIFSYFQHTGYIMTISQHDSYPARFISSTSIS